MSPVKWDKSLFIHIMDIDIQHQKMVSLINELETGITEGIDETSMSMIFEELINYTKRHFSLEEEYFLKIDYPDYIRHKNEHDFFTREIIYKYKKYREDGEAVSKELLEFLQSWFIHHIKQEDMKYKPYFEKHGLR